MIIIIIILKSYADDSPVDVVFLNCNLIVFALIFLLIAKLLKRKKIHDFCSERKNHCISGNENGFSLDIVTIFEEKHNEQENS